MRRTLVTLAALAALALTGCAGTDQGGGASPGSAAPGATSDELAGDWQLTAATDADGELELGVSVVTLTIGADAVTGNAPCNTYTAELETTGSGLAIERLIQTEIACADPEPMALEQRYLAALGEVGDGIRAGDVLTLTGDGVSLTFTELERQTVDGGGSDD
jgi:heat shock protein HslJ